MLTINNTIETMAKMNWRERYKLYADYIADLEMPEYKQDSLDFGRWLGAIEDHILDMPETELDVQEVLYLYIVERADVDLYDDAEQMPNVLGTLEGDWCLMALDYANAEDDAQDWFAEMEHLYHMWVNKVGEEFADSYSTGDGVPTLEELEGQLK